jgi:hypothetical protein
LDTDDAKPAEAGEGTQAEAHEAEGCEVTDSGRTTNPTTRPEQSRRVFFMPGGNA